MGKMTGVVLEIADGRAVLLGDDGTFASVPALPGWRQGEVVRLPAARRPPLWAVYAAACAVLALLLGFGGYRAYFTQVSLISLDVNPSIELGLNRFDRVVYAGSYNREGQRLLEAVQLRNKPYEEALSLLLGNPLLDKFIQRGPYVLIAVQSQDEAREQALLGNTQSCAGHLLAQHHAEAQVEYAALDAEMVEQAHAHGVTGGKYMALLELLEADPAADMEEFKHAGVAQIEAHISYCHGQTGHHGTQGAAGQDGGAADSPAVQEPPSGGGAGGGSPRAGHHHGHGAGG